MRKILISTYYNVYDSTKAPTAAGIEEGKVFEDKRIIIKSIFALTPARALQRDDVDPEDYLMATGRVVNESEITDKTGTVNLWLKVEWDNPTLGLSPYIRVPRECIDILPDAESPDELYKDIIIKGE